MGFLDLRRIPGTLHQTLFSFSFLLFHLDYMSIIIKTLPIHQTELCIGKKPWELKRQKKPKLFQKRAACVPRSSRNSWVTRNKGCDLLYALFQPRQQVGQILWAPNWV
jgi:hypothetical protein